MLCESILRLVDTDYECVGKALGELRRAHAGAAERVQDQRATMLSSKIDNFVGGNPCVLGYRLLPSAQQMLFYGFSEVLVHPSLIRVDAR
jgi:hypothetical protein